MLVNDDDDANATNLNIPLHDDQAFRTNLLELMDADVSRLATEELVRTARAILNTLTTLTDSANPARTISSETNSGDSLRVDVYKLLAAMLDCSVVSGGQRYVASAIVTAQGQERGRYFNLIVNDLKRLAEDWLFLLLWPCEFLFGHFMHTFSILFGSSVKKAYNSSPDPEPESDFLTPPVQPDYLTTCVPTSLYDQASTLLYHSC